MQNLNQRSIDIFRHIVESYLESGEAVGSRTLSQRLMQNLSPATIRNVMADLEDAGLLSAAHRSAGRMPTASGLRLFIDGMMEIGSVSEQEKNALQQSVHQGQYVDDKIERALKMVTNLSGCAGIVLAPKSEKPIEQIQFVNLGAGLSGHKILTVIVFDDGSIENRLIESDHPISASQMIRASNYLSEKMQGKTLSQAADDIAVDIHTRQHELDIEANSLIEKGLVQKSSTGDQERYIVRGQSHLLDNIDTIERLDHIRDLLQRLENQETMRNLLQMTKLGAGVQIFIGSENPVFDSEGLSLIIAPYQSEKTKIIGAVGVIGPTRLNYGRIMPIIDYTSRLLADLL
jgi:heat-inducible transcriptional repressor